MQRNMFNQYLAINAVLAVWITLTAAALNNDTCENGGTVGDGNHVICSCPPGFKGFDCSQRVTPCEGRPCRNGGVCSESKNGTFSCQCPYLFKGIICEQKVRPCDSIPCKNGGTCTDDGVRCFKCKCPIGFKGTDCSVRVKPCEIKPCKNNGKCIEEPLNRFKCECNPGYGGTFCDRRDGLYGSKILLSYPEFIKQLEKWLGGPRFAKLCYRATDHGWAASAFHAQCDRKEPTVTIIRSGKYIFGAYTDKAFGGSPHYIASSSSWLFSFVNKDKLSPFKSVIYRYNAKAVYTSLKHGPVFGGGVSGHDIYIVDHAQSNTLSSTNLGNTYKPPNGYKFNTAKTKQLLAGTHRFRVNEVETFWLY